MTAATERIVVVGVDGSEAALGAAQWAAGFASASTLPLTLLHVVPHLEELNIGHSIISRAVFVGLDAAVKEILLAMVGYPSQARTPATS